MSSYVISSETILQPSTLCVARPQKGGYLFYHYRTDELHLVPPEGYYVYQLCDGLRSVGEIESLFKFEPSTAPDPIRIFFEELILRGILEVAND